VTSSDVRAGWSSRWRRRRNDAWIKHYRPNENSENRSISYYTKGAVVVLLLDAATRRATGVARSLDDVMRRA
jgi:predicted metalloprotease with PDZ domain